MQDNALGMPNGEMDMDGPDDEEMERELFQEEFVCPQCGDEIAMHEQMCLYCTRKMFRNAGAPSGHFH